MPNAQEVVNIIQDEIMMSALTGVIAGLGSVYVLNASPRIPIPVLNTGISLPAPVSIGLAVASSNMVSAIVHDALVNNVDPSVLEPISNISRPLVNGAMSYATMRTLYSPNARFVQNFALGAGSSVLADYAGKTLMN